MEEFQLHLILQQDDTLKQTQIEFRFRVLCCFYFRPFD